jgi:hypothetical protein
MIPFRKAKDQPAETKKPGTSKLFSIVGETSESTKSELERLLEELEARGEKALSEFLCVRRFSVM